MTSNAAHGKNFQKFIYSELCLLGANREIKGVSQNFGVRHPGYSCADQYYAPFVVTLNSGVRWAIFTTTACRTDRIKGQQWDAEHIKMLCSDVVRVCLVYPDETDYREKQAFISQQRKYDTKWEYSCIDKIECFSEFIKDLKNG